MRSPMPDKRLLVVESFQEPRSTTNPYIVMLLQALREVAEVRTFNWKFALTKRYDVFHVHWPEVLLGSDRLSRRIARRICFYLLLGHLRAHNIAVVRTVHNPSPHERKSRIDTWLMHKLDRLTTCWIRLNPYTELHRQADVTTILHGHYRDWFPDEKPVAIGKQLVYFGLIRPYKGVDRLITEFREVDDPALRLVVLGKPNSDALGQLLIDAAQPDERISLELQHIPDNELARTIRASELVVLPYTEMHNSGALLVALSLNRPVLVPDTAVNRELAAEVGPQWFHFYTGALTAHALQSAISHVGQPDGQPDLSQRDWDTAATDHLEVFQRAVERVSN